MYIVLNCCNLNPFHGRVKEHFFIDECISTQYYSLNINVHCSKVNKGGVQMKFLPILLMISMFEIHTVLAEKQKGSVLLIIGTRPDCIKMAPVYFALKKEKIPTLLCSTDQHTDLLNDVADIFGLVPDYSLHIMKPAQDLFYITTRVLEELKALFAEIEPSLVVVQGDTTSAMAAALAAFYCKIPVAHVEAGLRTTTIFAPFPEELNRRVISLIASFHFAPTKLAENKLLEEHINADKIFNVGNTVVDSLQMIKQKIVVGELIPSKELVEQVTKAKDNNFTVMVLTAHRRESFAHGLKSIFSAVKKALELYPNLYIIYPTHPNPAIQNVLKEVQLHEMRNIFITKPLPYIDMVYLMSESNAILTDSGGLQEEGISLNKPVLVLRKETERMEGVLAGASILVGDDEATIVKEIGAFMQGCHTKRSVQHTAIYGDGTAGEQIASIIKNKLFSYNTRNSF